MKVKEWFSCGSNQTGITFCPACQKRQSSGNCSTLRRNWNEAKSKKRQKHDGVDQEKEQRNQEDEWRRRKEPRRQSGTDEKTTIVGRHPSRSKYHYHHHGDGWNIPWRIHRILFCLVALFLLGILPSYRCEGVQIHPRNKDGGGHATSNAGRNWIDDVIKEVKSIPKGMCM